VEAYVSRFSEAKFSHGMCPDCFDKVKLELEALDKGQTVANPIFCRPLTARSASFAAEFVSQSSERQGVDYVLFCEPAFAGDAGAKAEKASVFVAMRVAIDDAFNAFGFGISPMTPVHVETIGIRVEFDPRSCFGASIDHSAMIDFVRFALEQQAAGRVTQDMDVAVLRGANEAFGHFRFALGEALMNAGDDDIELREKLVIEIEFAFGQDVHFAASQEPEINAFCFE